MRLLLYSALVLCSARAEFPVRDQIVRQQTFAIQELTKKIQADQELSQSHLAKLRAMEEGSKEVAFAMSQMESLVKHGKLLLQSPSGSPQQVDPNTLHYDGSQFVGGNYGFVDNLMGLDGPLSLDESLPASLFPAVGNGWSNAQKNAASLAQNLPASLLQSAKELLTNSLPQAALLRGNELLTQQLESLLPKSGRNSAATSQSNRGMVADGVFIRPYAGQVDDAYQALVQKGTPQQQLQFYADSRLGAGGYHVALGTTNNPALNAVDLDNTLSGGAAGAYSQWSNQYGPGKSANPYSGYGSQITPQLLTALNQFGPGTYLTPTSQMTQNAATGLSPGTDLILDVPSLFEQSSGINSFVNASGFGAKSNTESSSLPRGIISVLPNASEAQSYRSHMGHSKSRLSENAIELKTKEQVYQYTQAIITSLSQVHEEAQKLQSALNQKELNSIPELTIMIRDVQQEIATRQRDLSDLGRIIDQLKLERHNELVNRSEYRRHFIETLNISSPNRAQAAMTPSA